MEKVYLEIKSLQKVVYLASQRKVVFLVESQSRASQLHHQVSLAIRNLLADSLEVTRSQLKLNHQVSSEATRSQLTLNHQVSLEVNRNHPEDYLVTLNQLK